MADVNKPDIVPPEIAPAAGAVVGPDPELLHHLADENVSISLKYYHRKSECWSDWQQRELKDLSGTIEKLRNVSVAQLKQGGGPRYDTHKGPPKGGGFKRPDSLSADLQFCEIGLNKKARLHGFISGSVFFLVWLDRNHQVFPQ